MQLCRLEALGEHISELISGRHSLETKRSELCRYVRKVLTNVDMLRTPGATDHILSPLNALRSVVLIHLASEKWVRTPCPDSPVAADEGR